MLPVGPHYTKDAIKWIIMFFSRKEAFTADIYYRVEKYPRATAMCAGIFVSILNYFYI